MNRLALIKRAAALAVVSTMPREPKPVTPSTQVFAFDSGMSEREGRSAVQNWPFGVAA